MGGYSGVIIFFVISGFFQYKENLQLNHKTYLNWILKRHIRVYPSFLVVLFIAIIARQTCPSYDRTLFSEWINGFWSKDYAFPEVLKSFILISSFDADLINPAIWTLRVEMRMCFILPFISAFINKHSLYAGVGCIALSVIHPLFSYLPAFYVGMVLKKHINHISINKRLILPLALLGIILLDTRYILNWAGIGFNDLINVLLTSSGAGLMVLTLYNITEASNNLERGISRIGDVSYNIYLIHMVTLMWLRFVGSFTPFYIYGIVCFIITIILSFLMEIIEKPIITYLDIIRNKVINKI